MSIADRIQAINDHLIDDYKVLRLAGADLTGVNKNIVNLKMSWKERLLYFMNNGTDVVWNNWDKVTGEGTSISLNNTLEGKMKIDLKGNTSQEGTPTPETPQDIHVVSGDNSIEVVGKNLLDSSTFLAGSYQGIDTTTRLHTGQALLLESNTYTLSTNLDMSTYKFYIVTGSTQVPFQTAKYNSGWVTNQQYSFTLGDSNKGYFCLCIGKVNGGTLTVDDIKDYHFQLEKGNQATTYEPYTNGASYPISLGDIELLKIGTYQDKIDKSSGKNSFNPEDFITAMSTNYREIKTTNGVEFICLGRSQSTATTYTYSLNCKENTQYTLSFKYISNACSLTVSYSDGTDSGSLTPNKTTLTNVSYTSEANKTITGITLYCGGWYVSGNKLEITQIMLNEGTTVLEYEPYGTGWYVKKEIGKVVLDGSETWSSAGTSYYTSILQSLIAETPATSQQIGYSNFFKVVGFNYQSDNNLWFHPNKNLQMKNTNYPTLNDWKTWLSTNKPELIYPLATPTYTEIEDSTLISQLEALKSKTGQTNISQTNNDMPSILNATALKEMA